RQEGEAVARRVRARGWLQRSSSLRAPGHHQRLLSGLGPRLRPSGRRRLYQARHTRLTRLGNRFTVSFSRRRETAEEITASALTAAGGEALHLQFGNRAIGTAGSGRER